MSIIRIHTSPCRAQRYQCRLEKDLGVTQWIQPQSARRLSWRHLVNHHVSVKALSGHEARLKSTQHPSSSTLHTERKICRQFSPKTSYQRNNENSSDNGTRPLHEKTNRPVTRTRHSQPSPRSFKPGHSSYTSTCRTSSQATAQRRPNWTSRDSPKTTQAQPP
jgi:hypothetical protein